MASSVEEPQVTVLGAGIIGICCALSLLERGVSVRLIDKAPPAEGASCGNAGVISPLGTAPATGWAIAGLLTGTTAEIDLGPYRVDRFH